MVLRDAPAKKTGGGIELPQKAQVKPKQGTVIAFGPGRTLENGERSEMPIKEGDRVLFTSYAGLDVEEIDGFEGDIILMRCEDILASQGSLE